MSGVPCITVALSDDQMKAIASKIDEAKAASIAGHPGMILAQIFDGEMKVFFANTFQAAQFQRAMGTPVGMTNAEALAVRDKRDG
jgi:hypothetical protein